jgi:hypothetical protein
MFIPLLISSKVETTLVSSMTRLSIDGSNFREKLNLLQFHFHWGQNDYQGSEHQINERKFPLEVIRI